ncbi:fungal-specific transcription factor domain-containing protein [Mycena sp. CBHHK59/15]|nr:fungal-specific transcription factor domain-containing protein [Mycena sp. CBHHK59/15]
MAMGPSETKMTSHPFQLLSDQEIIDMKRSRGIMACAECQRRKLKCDKKVPCTSCVRRGREDICPTGDSGPIGRGRRVMRSESLELSTTIHNMGDRIRQLETAVAEAHAEESDSTHPLLREGLLGIKLSTELPRSSSDPTPAQLADTFGALAISASGTARYFGPTAGPAALLSAQGSAGGDRAEFASLFADITESFPFDAGYSSSWDTALCLENLLGHLPDELRAWALYDIFVNEASWYGTPIMADELHELLAQVYDPNSNPYELSPHALAMVFQAFALAALADLSLPAYSVQADTYFDLGRTALTLQPVFGSRDLHTIQALVLVGLYYATGGPRYSVDSAWSIVSLACSLCQSLRLHREGAHTGFDNKTAQRRRAMFWEIHSLETYQALSFARPLSIPLADITCEFPADTDQTMDSQGSALPGFYHTKWKFTKEITAPMAQVYTSATPPTYEQVLDLDRRLRQFMEAAPFDHYKGSTFLAYVRTHLIPRFSGDLMLYMHRGSFVQALKDRPHNPLDSPYAASFLAAYRGASSIIKSDLSSFSLYPDHFHRWWPIWKSLVNAAFIVGSIVAKCPTSEIAPTAFMELQAAVELVERGAMHSFLAEGSLLVLQRLRNKATSVYTEFRPPGIDGSPRPNPSELADDKDFEMLGGSRAFLERSSVPRKPISLPNTTVSIPTLIPRLMPPASTPDPWQPQIPDSSYSSFVFDALIGSAPILSSTPADGLEAYLAAQMQSTSTNYPDAVPETDWAAFISSLE